ncbi:MAG TPA: lipoprotein [Steroidobacteraceae bacterium]|nr:lipoprotein [Steroidobacteraceae bacterium]
MKSRTGAAWLSALAVTLALASTSCGQKGPLFLPDRETTVVQPPAPTPGTEPASEETKKKEEPR